MVDNELLSKESLGFEEWAVTPEPEHLVPDSVERQKTRNEFIQKLQSDPSAVVITHNDADGLGSGALVVERHGPETAVMSLSYGSPYKLHEALGDVAEQEPDCPVYITDLGCDDRLVVDPLEKIDETVTWYDHHQWEDDVKQDVIDAGVKLVIDEDECGTSLIEREMSYDFPPHIQELAEVTKDIDLWIKEDPRSDRLGVMAFALEVDEYIETVIENGVNHPEWVEEKIDEQLETNEELEDFAVYNADSVMVNGYSVAFTYIKGGRSSTIGNRLVEEHEPVDDIAIVQRPKGISVYSHSNRETFAKCHEIAGELGGGGHPTASGFPIPVETFRELAEYWRSEGQSAREEIWDVIFEVTDDE